MSRLRDIKRRMRGDLHAQASVPALYIPVPNAAPIECTVRVWLKSDEMTGAAQQNGSAQMTNPEDRLRFDLSEFQAPLRVQTAIISVEAGEAYRIDHLYPADLGYQTARVTRLGLNEAAGLPVPDGAQQPTVPTIAPIVINRVTYTHTQTVPATLWTVNHNLGFHPVVSVLDALGNEMDCQVTHISLNQLTVSISSPMTGEARCV
jgi:hypothetical protein